MSRLYVAPLRVYLVMALLTGLGIFFGLRLPVSLFPNSSKPFVWVGFSYGSLSAEAFLKTYGQSFEWQLRSISSQNIAVEKLVANYGDDSANYDIEFKWGVQPDAALKEVQNVANSFASRLPPDSRDSLGIWLSHKNSGFFAMSFFSNQRSLDEVYDILEPVLLSRLTKIQDTDTPILWNPSSREIRIEMNPETLASLRLLPRDIEAAVAAHMEGHSGGGLPTQRGMQPIELPRQIKTVDDFARIPIQTPAGIVHLSDIGHIDIRPKSLDSSSFKTSGAPSLILYARPKPGGNVKRMAEDILEAVNEVTPSLPKDIQHKVLVDPSLFIRAAIRNVLHEVGIAALLAVLVLFLFIGSVRNVITAAIEIPMSMVLAFILMKWSGMNLNLISLGGLALAAGMNVDASVVVMENIFRYFEMYPGPHSVAARVQIVTRAVKEVRLPVIASTIASLVVFLPLTFTSELSFAILGDLALAVVFSHGLSALIALVLVPTIRLHLMNSAKDIAVPKSPIERQIRWLEETYEKTLAWFLENSRIKGVTYAFLTFLFLALCIGILPRLPKEIVGKPDTDWVVLRIETQGNTLVKQMEAFAEEKEREILKEFGGSIQYTFTDINNPNGARIMARLKKKGEMNRVWKAMEKRFVNSPTVTYGVHPWNPSELPIPDPPDFQIAIRGGTPLERNFVSKKISDGLHEQKLFSRFSIYPPSEKEFGVFLTPRGEIFHANRGSRVRPSDLADIIRIATVGRRAALFPLKNENIEVVLGFPQFSIKNLEDIESFPIGLENKIIPLRALAEVSLEERRPTIRRENGREVSVITARQNKGEEFKNKEAIPRARTLLGEFQKDKNTVIVTEEDPAKDLTESIHQLSLAVALSLALIFFTLLLQFGSLVESILIMVAIPLGIVGVLTSLFVFRSTLSLNSILGVILLNGIAVANSIILIDLTRRLVQQGLSPREAVLQAGRKRLRPILITSLSTILGMLPIALGTGEGGRVLQPLGIAVSGGLWVSMLLTLYLVPALYVGYFESIDGVRRWIRKVFRVAPAPISASFLILVISANSSAIPFTDAIEIMVNRSTQVSIERTELESIRAQNLLARWKFLPSVSIQGSHVKSSALGGPQTRTGAELLGEINLFRFGSDLHGYRSTSAAERSQEAMVQDTILKAESDAIRVACNFILTNQERKILLQILETREKALRIAGERYQRGLLAQQEVDKVAIDLENTRVRLTDTDTSIANARAELTALLGHHQIDILWPFSDSLEVKGKKLLVSETVPLENRPDWIAVQHRIDALDYKSSQAWAKLFPSLDLSVGYGYFTYPSPKDSGIEWRTGVTLTIPLFERFSTLSNYRVAVHSKARADVEMEKVKRDAKAEWDTNRESLSLALMSLKSRSKTLELSRKLYADNFRRFERGLVSANDLMVDQDRLYASELASLRGMKDAHLTFVRLCHASGKRLVGCLSTI